MAMMVIGVMGGGESTSEYVCAQARRLGELIAEQGWVLLTGGRNVGVMQAASHGAHAAGGLTVGVLPDDHDGRMSEYVDIPILTGMGNARNVINILSSAVVIALPGGAGTLAEIALALKSRKPVILLNVEVGELIWASAQPGQMHEVNTPQEAIDLARLILEEPDIIA